MDIFNRPPAISEDTLQYTLYPPSDLTDKASVTTFAACIQDFVESLTHGLIWHRDPFELKVVSDLDKDGWMLEGRMRVGDCVDDEWCVVWLLREVSEKWDVIIRSVASTASPSSPTYLRAAFLTRTGSFYSSKPLKRCRRG